MKKIALILVIALSVSACEMFVIGSKKKPEIPLDQTSPIGTVMLFKVKLDSNIIQDAAALMLKNSGQQYLAIEKVELFDDLKRLGRIIANRKITRHTTDTLSTDYCIVNMEFDYLYNYKFNTKIIKNKWFITGYKRY